MSGAIRPRFAPAVATKSVGSRRAGIVDRDEPVPCVVLVDPTRHRRPRCRSRRGIYATDGFASVVTDVIPLNLSTVCLTVLVESGVPSPLVSSASCQARNHRVDRRVTHPVAEVVQRPGEFPWPAEPSYRRRGLPAIGTSNLSKSFLVAFGPNRTPQVREIRTLPDNHGQMPRSLRLATPACLQEHYEEPPEGEGRSSRSLAIRCSHRNPDGRARGPGDR